MERVKIIRGKSPIIFIAPYHGPEAENTDFIVEQMAHNTKSYAVINKGWKIGPKVDCMTDIANCGKISHCLEDVVKEEFLDPIIRFKSQILKKNKKAYIVYIHGMSNKHRIMANDPTMDMVIGYGEGYGEEYPNSHTFDLQKKDLLIELLEDVGIIAYEGSKNSNMSGWSKESMNQLFRKFYFDRKVESLQIKIIQELREDKNLCIETSKCLGECFLNSITNISFIKKFYKRIY